MQTKLTVRVDHELIQSAKRYANRQGITLSQLINDYLRAIVITQDDPFVETPILHRLSGILPADASVEEYQNHLVEKYG
jgi:antitoxin component of RelBE/YafQ-DinJ toxin-antitoxin module